MIRVWLRRLLHQAPWCVAIGLMLVMALAVFWSLLGTGSVLMSTDDNIGLVAGSKRLYPYAWRALWYDATLLGFSGGVAPLSWVNGMMTLLPAAVFTNWIHAIDLVLAGTFLMLALRRGGVGWAGCLLGALTAYWLGSNFTLVYAGHTPKFGVLMFAAAALWALQHAVEGPARIRWSLVTGGLLGAMFLEQQDLALFFGLFLGAYGLMRLWPTAGQPWMARAAGTLVPMGLAALLIAGPTLLASYATNVKGVASVSEEDPQEKWEFCTQWSVPTDETIDLIAPGYTGWRSGEPDGPYWGRTGQSAGWEQTHRGFMNFRLESIYVGAIPVALALFALVAACFGDRYSGNGAADDRPPMTDHRSPMTDDRSPITDSNRRREVLFWSAAALVALLLAYGKYFPLYALFYKLPLVNSIRNPNKFIQVFQMALGILAAYGLDTALRLGAPRPAAERNG